MTVCVNTCVLDPLCRGFTCWKWVPHSSSPKRGKLNTIRVYIWTCHEHEIDRISVFTPVNTYIMNDNLTYTCTMYIISDLICYIVDGWEQGSGTWGSTQDESDGT